MKKAKKKLHSSLNLRDKIWIRALGIIDIADEIKPYLEQKSWSEADFLDVCIYIAKRKALIIDQRDF